MSEVPSYEGPARPLFCSIEALFAVNTAEFNHRAVGIRNCESAFHLASTILGGRDIVEEFVAADIWPISYGWGPQRDRVLQCQLGNARSPFPEVRH
jgi:hypothetical protein